jgi:DNA-binding transcriptional LysR family regulator
MTAAANFSRAVAFLAGVVDAGGYAQAAVVMHKSQSAVTYAVQKVEALLGVKVFSMVGRKAHLTPAGEVLYRRAKACSMKRAHWKAAARQSRSGMGVGTAHRRGNRFSHLVAAAIPCAFCRRSGRRPASKCMRVC